MCSTSRLDSGWDYDHCSCKICGVPLSYQTVAFNAGDGKNFQVQIRHSRLAERGESEFKNSTRSMPLSWLRPGPCTPPSHLMMPRRNSLIAAALFTAAGSCIVLPVGSQHHSG